MSNKKNNPSLIGKYGRQTEDRDQDDTEPKCSERLRKKPWLDENGKPLSEDALKKVCSSWSIEEWGKYLDSTEPEPEEYLLENPLDSEQVPNTSLTSELFYVAKSNKSIEPTKLEQAIQRVLNFHLSKREKEIIWMRYWNDMSQYQIANEIGIARGSVQIILRRAEEKVSSRIFQESLKNYKYIRDLQR